MLHQRLVADAALPLASFGRAGPLEVRLAASAADVAEAQALRYAIFYQELGAEPSAEKRSAALDIDPYDAVCDHLLVIDHDADSRIVGTYRLLRQDVAVAHGGFYSGAEFDLAPLVAAAQGSGQLLELGRSCVAPAYRTTATISLLWRGIAAYLQTHGISYMFGCASFSGTDPDRHAPALSFLHTQHLAPEVLRVRALPGHFVAMNRLPDGDYDQLAALRSLPPLLKGYLRVGAKVGDGAFIDWQFNTVDVFVVMPVAAITRRYLDHYLSDRVAA